MAILVFDGTPAPYPGMVAGHLDRHAASRLPVKVNLFELQILERGRHPCSVGFDSAIFNRHILSGHFGDS